MSKILDKAKKALIDDLDRTEATMLKRWEAHVKSHPAEFKEFENAVMIGFQVDVEEVFSLRAKFGDYAQDPNDLHITLYYMGDVRGDLDLTLMKKSLELFAQTQAPIVGKYNGIGMFEVHDGKYPVILLYDSPQMVMLRVKLADVFGGLGEDQIHGFTPHTTLAWMPEDLDVQITQPIEIPVVFTSITLFWGKDHYTYDLTGDLVEIKQLPIDEAGRQRLIQVRREIFNNVVDGLAERVYSGEVSLGQWEELMRAEIKAIHSSVAAIKKGGWDAMTSRDWGRIGTPVRQQNRYLHGFAEAIAENRDTISLEAIKARAHLYAEATGHTGNLIISGPDLEAILPWMPKDGSTKCLVNCKCQWTQTLVDRVGNYNIWQSVWKLNPAEHCRDCVPRKDHTVIYRLHKDIPVPPVIGGY
jgi:2'-5' RNA ligase